MIRHPELFNSVISTFNSLPFMVSFKDKNHHITWVNKAWLNTFQLDECSVIGKTLPELFPDIAKSILRQYDWDDDYVISGKPIINKNESFFVGSTMKFGLTNKIPYYNSLNEIEGIVSFTTDVSDVIRQSRELEIFMSNSVDMHIEFDRKGIYRKVYPGKIKPFLSVEEVIGKSVYEVFAYYPSIIEQFDNALSILESKKETTIEYELDGFTYEAILSLFNENSILAQVRDITNRKKLKLLDQVVLEVGKVNIGYANLIKELSQKTTENG